jgi:hypothetical protein
VDHLAREQRQGHLAATLHNYRLTIDTKIKPGLGHLPITKVDARVLDRFYAALRKGGNARTGDRAKSASKDGNGTAASDGKAKSGEFAEAEAPF